MSDTPTDKKLHLDASGRQPGERVVYVMPRDMMARHAEDEIDLIELWKVVWRRKWQILAIAFLFAAGSVAYALLATEWYRAEVLLAPADERSTTSLGGQLGGLAALAGVSVGGGDSAVAIATLKSREFARAFIEDYELLTLLFADQWDESGQRWRENDPEKWPDIRDAVKYFQENILRVNEDNKTGLVKLAIEWTDAEVAAKWANEIVQRINNKLRERALREAETNVSYLQAELSQTTVVTLQQSISRLLESELQKLMLARGNEEFAFRVIDSAAVPNQRIKPQRALIVVVATFFGGVLGVFFVLLAHAFRSMGRKSA